MLILIYSIVIAGVLAIVILIAKNAKSQDNNQKDNISNTSMDSQNQVKSKSYPAWFEEMEKEREAEKRKREEEIAFKEDKTVADQEEVKKVTMAETVVHKEAESPAKDEFKPDEASVPKVESEIKSQEESVAENIVKSAVDVQPEEKVPEPEVETTEKKVPGNNNFLNELDSGSIELITDKLYKLSELEKQGLITKDDLEKAKAKLLSGAS